MIVNIGPWWLYDIFAFLVIIGGISFGLRRGFLITLYVLGLQIIALVINLFIPTLLTNIISPPIVNLLKTFGFTNLVNTGANQIGTVFMNLLKSLIGETDFTFSWDGLGEELIKVLVATVLFYVFSIMILVTVNIIGIIVYHAAVKNKLRMIKVLGPADMILGMINGFLFGMLFSVYLSTMVSLPVFATETQKIGVFNYSALTDEQKVEWAKNGNSYNTNSLSKKITFSLPTLTLGKYMYTNACVQKYLLDPATAIATQYLDKTSEGNVFQEIPAEAFDQYAQLMIDGYVSNNPLSAPISACIQIMPEDARPLLRTVAEIMLVTPRSLLVEEGTTVASVQTKVTSVDIINAFEAFRESKNYVIDYDNPSSFMTLSRFQEFYRWTEDTGYTNPFTEGAKYFDELGEQNNFDSDKKLADVLRSATKTYSLFRNIFFVNNMTNSNPNLPVFVPSAWSNIFIAQSIELSFNGQLMGNLFNKNLIADWNNINPQAKRLLTRSDSNANPSSNDYTGFWMQYYFDFAKLG